MKYEGIRYEVILINAIELNDDIKEYSKKHGKQPLAVLFGTKVGISPSCIHHARARYQTYMGVHKVDKPLNMDYGLIEERHYLSILKGFEFEDKYRVPEEVETVVEDDMALVDDPKTTIDYTEQIADIHDAVIEVADDLAETLAEIDKKKSDELRELTLSVNRLGNCMMQMLDYLKEIKDKVVTE